LILYEVSGEKGKVTPFIRINWVEFERRIKLYMQNKMDQLKKEYDQAISSLLSRDGGNTTVVEIPVVWWQYHRVVEIPILIQRVSQEFKEKTISTPVKKIYQ